MKPISAASLLVVVGVVVGTFSFALASGVPATVVRIRRSVNTLGTVPKRTTPVAGNNNKKRKRMIFEQSLFDEASAFLCLSNARGRSPREEREKKKKKRGVSHPFEPRRSPAEREKKMKKK